MIYLSKSNRGFVSVNTLFLFGIFFSLLFSFLFLVFLSFTKAQFRKTCFTESIALQKKIVEAEKKLFALNPVSTALKTKLVLHQVALAAAIAVSNYAEATHQTLEINKTIDQQKKLDAAQKNIIQLTNAYIASQNTLLTYKLNQESNSLYKERWTQFLNAFYLIQPLVNTTMAVQAESSDLAPNYGLKKDYKQLQMVAYKWHLRLSTRSQQQRIVESANSYEQICAVTANKGDLKWSIEIAKGKSY